MWLFKKLEKKNYENDDLWRLILIFNEFVFGFYLILFFVYVYDCVI